MLANEQAQQTVGATVANAPETSDTYDVPAGLHTSDSVAGSGRSNVTTPGNELPGAFPRSPCVFPVSAVFLLSLDRPRYDVAATSGASPSTTTTLVESAQNTPATAQHAAPQHAAPVVHDATQPAAGVPTSAVEAAQPSRPLGVVGTLEGSGGAPLRSACRTRAHVTQGARIPTLKCTSCPHRRRASRPAQGASDPSPEQRRSPMSPSSPKNAPSSARWVAPSGGRALWARA